MVQTGELEGRYLIVQRYKTEQLYSYEAAIFFSTFQGILLSLQKH